MSKHQNDNITVPPVRESVQFRNTEGFMVLERTYRRDTMRHIHPEYVWNTVPIAYVFPDNRPQMIGKHREGEPVPHPIVPMDGYLERGWNLYGGYSNAYSIHFSGWTP